MRKKIIVFVLLFVFAFGLVGSSPALAAETEDMKYMEYIDSKYSITYPQVQFLFNPNVAREYKFMWFEFGNIIEISSYDIFEILYGCYLQVNNRDVADVGFLLTDMCLRVDVTYKIISDDYIENSFSTYQDFVLSEIYSSGNDFLGLTFDYDDVISWCENSEGFVCIECIDFTIYSRVLNRRGSTYSYSLNYKNNDYDSLIIDGIDSYVTRDGGMISLGNNIDLYFDDNYSQGFITSLDANTSHYDENKTFDEFISSFLSALPGVFTFCIELMNLLPDFIGACIPFLPLYLIRAFMYVLYFAIGVGVYKLLRG